MPPAKIAFWCPHIIDWAAIITAFMLFRIGISINYDINQNKMINYPEAHTLLTVVAGVVFDKPANIKAWVAGACPCPACSTFPI